MSRGLGDVYKRQAIYAAGIADSLQAGVEVAQQAIASGAAKQKLKDLIEFSNSV